MNVLTVNAGSSSARFAVYDVGARESLLVSAGCEGIGLATGRCRVRDGSGRTLYEGAGSIADHESAARRVAGWLQAIKRELRGDVFRRQIAAAGARPTSLQQIAGEELHVGADSATGDCRGLGAKRDGTQCGRAEDEDGKPSSHVCTQCTRLRHARCVL